MKTIFQAFWHGPRLNALHWACMRSFLRRGHDFHLYTYDAMEVPEGVTVLDASEILPLKSLYFFEDPDTGIRYVSPFSDLFRYKLLLDRGGWWIDVDTFCMSDDIAAVPYAWAQENPKLYPGVINGAQLALPQGDPLARALYERCPKSTEACQSLIAAGPELLSEVINSSHLPPNMYGTTETFYPVAWSVIVKLVLPVYRDEVQRLVSAAKFLSVYQSFFRFSGIDLAAAPPAGSFLREQYERFAPERMLPNVLTVDDVVAAVKGYVDRNPWFGPHLIEAGGAEMGNIFGLQ